MIKDSTKIAVLALLAGTALGAEAAVVSPADAKLIATDFITSAKALSPTQSIPLKLVATGGTSTKPTFYVFNATDGKAFVIVSAEDCTSPIVGYSLTAAYPVSSTPVAMKWGRPLSAASRTRSMNRRRPLSSRYCSVSATVRGVSKNSVSSL